MNKVVVWIFIHSYNLIPNSITFVLFVLIFVLAALMDLRVLTSFKKEGFFILYYWDKKIILFLFIPN